MMTPGRALYLLHTRFGHGLRVAWYRDVVRPRILATPPIPVGKDSRCEIHTLTSADDWLNLLWALKSFFRHSGRRYALCIHDDGTLDAAAREHLRTNFPGARLIPREEADRKVGDLLGAFPHCRALRTTNKLSPKIFDFTAFLECDRMMPLDSDILFFAQPTALLGALEHNATNTLGRDWRYGYSIDLEATRPLLDFVLPSLINSGLGLIHRASLRIDWIEEFLALPGIMSNAHVIEQTLTALCSARFGFTMLPAEYDVHLGQARPGIPSRHYSGPVRHLMYREGMRRLAKAGFLRAT